VVGQFFAAFPPQRSEDRRQRTEASRSGDRRAKTKTTRHASHPVLAGARGRESGVRNQESANSHRRIIMRKILLVLVMTPWGSAAGGAWADVKATIADIERLPRGKRPAGYEGGLGEKNVAAGARGAMIRAFAKLIKVLSPAYAKDRFPFDEQSWIALLRQGFDADARAADLRWGIVRRLGDSQG